MSRYFVEHVDCSFDAGGTACGPVSGAICTSVKYRKDNGPSQWLELDEVDGMPNFYLSNRDQFEYHVNFDSDDEKEIEQFNESYIQEFEGISLSDDYGDLYEQFFGDQKDNPASALLRYIIQVARCPAEELEHVINMGTGKYIDEVDIPISEDEQDYI